MLSKIDVEILSSVKKCCQRKSSCYCTIDIVSGEFSL